MNEYQSLMTQRELCNRWQVSEATRRLSEGGPGYWANLRKVGRSGQVQARRCAGV